MELCFGKIFACIYLQKQWWKIGFADFWIVDTVDQKVVNNFTHQGSKVYRKFLYIPPVHAVFKDCGGKPSSL